MKITPFEADILKACYTRNPVTSKIIFQNSRATSLKYLYDKLAEMKERGMLRKFKYGKGNKWAVTEYGKEMLSVYMEKTVIIKCPCGASFSGLLGKCPSCGSSSSNVAEGAVVAGQLNLVSFR